MTKKNISSLLPDGVKDILPPYADMQLDMENSFFRTLRTFGYAHVRPPLIEFVDSLLGGNAAIYGNQTFKILDTSTHKMMGVRADMTMQIGRIASMRMRQYPRPLRLMYGGDVLVTHAHLIRTDRVFKQYGAELIGLDNANSDGEIVNLAVTALQNIGIKKLSIDVCLPLLPRLCARAVDMDFSQVQALLKKKDFSAIKKLPSRAARLFTDLLNSSGNAKNSLPLLKKSSLPTSVIPLIERLKEMLAILDVILDDTVKVTVDVCETKGFPFHNGIAFTIFSKDALGELGRGGRYALQGGEPSVGFSLYSDSLMQILTTKDRPLRRCVYAPFGTSCDRVKSLREKQGQSVICGLAKEQDVKQAATSLGCTHLLENNMIKSI